jgi:hypothetical protein
MAVSTSTAIKNARLDAISSTWGASPKLRLYAGTPPANAAAALSSNSLLVEVTITPAAASNATKDMLGGAKSGTGAAAAGTGTTTTFYRIYDSGGTTCHEQGAVAQSASSWSSSTAYTVGQRVSNNGNIYNCTTAGTSASSGGPSGTGGSITDGTVTWAYVSAVGDIAIDNPSIAQNQAVNINTFTKTEP